MSQLDLAEWAVTSSLVDGVLFSQADADLPAQPVCAVAAVRGARGFGKGLTQRDALASALGEALEQYTAAQARLEGLLYAPFCEVAPNAFDPRWLSLYAPQQYDRPGFPYPVFDANRPMRWVAGEWLDSGESVWMPAFATYLSSMLKDEALCQVTSNGLAAGSSVSDAGARAALELQERHAFLTAWDERLAGRLWPRNDLSGDYEPLIADIRSRGAEIEVSVIAAEPYVAVCVARGDCITWPAITIGLGAASNARDAVQKAILEHGQTGPLLARIWRNGEQAIPATPEEIRTLRDHALYYCDPACAHEFDFLRGEGALVEWPLEQRIAIADLTTPDLLDSPFRVVRALGRGLKPLWCGYGFERGACSRNSAPPPIC